MVISALGKPTVTTKYIYISHSTAVITHMSYIKSQSNPTFSHEVALCRHGLTGASTATACGRHHKELKASAKYLPYKNQGQFK